MSAKKVNSSASKLTGVMAQCHQTLKFLQSKEEAGAFLEPVDWNALGLPDYPSVIKKPMDLGTIEDKLNTGKYDGPPKFAADVRLVFKNAMTYNRPDSDIYETANKLTKLFDKKFEKLGKADGADAPPSDVKKEPNTGEKKRKTPATKDSSLVTRADRLKLSQLVNQLTSDELGEFIDMVKTQAPNALNELEEDEVEIEINVIDGATLINLIDFSSKCVLNNKKRKKSP